MSLVDRIKARRERADLMIEHCRGEIMRKAVTGGNSAIAAVSTGGAMPGGIDTRLASYNAREQYAHNRGWVATCVRLIAQRVAAQEICVARELPYSRRGSISKTARLELKQSLPTKLKGRAGRLEPLPQHSLLDVLDDPSELSTSWSLIFVTVASLELTGRGLWWVTETEEEDGGRRAILHLPTSWVESVDSKRAVWIIRPGNSAQSFSIPGDQIVHFYYPDPADPNGCLSPLLQVASAVLSDEAISESQLQTFKNGQKPGLVLKAGRLPGVNGAEGQRPVLTAEQRSQLITAIRQAYSGVHRWNEPIIVDGLIDEITKISLTPAELDFMNSAKLPKSKILQCYGVSPILLGENENGNRAQSVYAEIIFLANKINPLIQMLSQAMTAWLT